MLRRPVEFTQYTSHDYQAALHKQGIVSSLSRRGQCGDNAVVESFFGSLKNDLALPRRHQTPAEVRTKIFDYIEIFYNRRRLHSSNVYRSPAQAEAEAA